MGVNRPRRPPSCRADGRQTGGVTILRRECREELGVEVEGFVPLDIKFSDPSLTMKAFLVTRWRGEPTNTAPDEHDDLAWFTPDEIADLTLAHSASGAALPAAALVRGESGHPGECALPRPERDASRSR